MTDIRYKESLKELVKALARLEELLNVPMDSKFSIRDAVIQRFEFCIELYWKTFRHLIALQGEQVTFPREALKRAYQAGWIDDEGAWLSMLKDRNLTSHTYNQELAQVIYERIQKHYPELKKVCDYLVKKYP
ncbi:MAG: HI0074 family nucleotidyltransferase substrate-binding subunit [Candidatus Caenarcaniphilales bacterium]|nr:HI0074 family nucleotidyltransferase substrate-binding subunit [Candidatus Caenarcaniphilales bacterium]